MTRHVWAIVGNPENRRIALFQRALASFNAPPATVLSYQALLTGSESLEMLPQHAIVRWESPGENFEVEKLLIAAGAEAAEEERSPVIAPPELRNLAEDRGRILHPRQWYLGFRNSCQQWFRALSTRPDLTPTTTYDDLRVQFDKRLSQQLFSDYGIPVPQSLGHVIGWDDLLDRMDKASQPRVFVKLANSSSASGVVALHVRAGRVEATTSVELVRSRGELLLYNSLKVRRYTNQDDARDLINALAAHHVHTEQWMPKAAQQRRVCDLRVVVIGGEPMHAVLRTSRNPLTNLHLGNRRGDVDAFLASMPQEKREALRETCRRCSQALEGSLHIGVDLLLTPGFRKHCVLESNAFGDLLPGVLHNGRSTYQAEIDCIEGSRT